MLEHITPVILTYNEAPNIGRTLNALTWAKRIVVMDSFSDDATESICKAYNNVDFYQRKFDVLAIQWKAAIAQNITTEWILALDADYVLSDTLFDEISSLTPEPLTRGYRTSFIYKIDGKPLRGTLYPPVITLYRAEGADYRQDGHAQRVIVAGNIQDLNASFYHDDRKPLARWHQSQRNYAAQEAVKFKQTSFSELGWVDKLRFIGLGPILVLPYTLLVKRTLLDGWPGLKYTGQRVIAELYQLRARFSA